MARKEGGYRWSTAAGRLWRGRKTMEKQAGRDDDARLG
jgi:hypothetical protein